MGKWITSVAGTEQGATLASALALTAAFLHAVFGALQKGRHDPWISRAAIDICYGIMALPVALFLVPWPDRPLWLALAGAVVIHIVYKMAQAQTYQRGAYIVVYPVVRGSAPFFAVLAAMLVFHERFNTVQWLGLALLVGGIFALAAHNYRKVTVGRETLVPALLWALATGATVALYTTYDAWGIRLAQNPFTFLAWFFLLDAFFMPIWNMRRLAALPRSELGPLMGRGVIGALVAFASFGSIMIATRLDEVGRAAVLRETSTVFAALVGWLILGEKVGARRAVLMAVIAAGAMIVEFAA
ncbi:DMT family transporter [Paracoccus sp. 1_MG-2023]|uniref:DMT family transporter n=1 Tax=unclassified Paracoccus (in: a-proteobacteria) TaxID=2688777 RepID=UPI001C090F8D|nr:MULTISPECIES: DMT family transporter [unclassified Paracoccus (in: a-proteobacteria)]MBU2959016.1 DMT family transporter [Paracoccus sp. C2R09]MDO6668988.1 DMT family transporter [Paracoccus sp. 1_MG-2023]